MSNYLSFELARGDRKITGYEFDELTKRVELLEELMAEYLKAKIDDHETLRIAKIINKLEGLN